MANLTITVDDQALKKARLRALEEGTSINAILKELLEAYAGVNKNHLVAADNLLRLSEQANSQRGAAKWSREELYERD